jgi:galactokinase
VAVTKSVLTQHASELFRREFNDTPHFVVSAPARVNLIGEHTDYNDGYVLPAAIDRYTVIAVGPRRDAQLIAYSDMFKNRMQTPLAQIHRMKDPPWGNYVLGVAAKLQSHGAKLCGTNLAIASSIPVGAGVSSSASVELATAYALVSIAAVQHLSPLEIIQLSQEAEHDFTGVQCGIMDQFICCLATNQTAMFLDCRTLHYERVKIPVGVELIICNTGVGRELKSSEYNARRNECQQGVRELSVVLPGIRALRDVRVNDLRAHGHLLSPVVLKRCRHVVMENERVLESAEALKRGDLSDFGKLMYQSHVSLKNDYEVSCPELDAIVDICAEEPGVFGARMTGAGFGGSAICLAGNDATQRVVERLQSEYPKQTGRKADIHVCSIVDGVEVHKI